MNGLAGSSGQVGMGWMDGWDVVWDGMAWVGASIDKSA